MKIATFGPGPKFKGGIANYNTSLAKAFDKLENTEVHIVSWTQQYPAIIPRDFIDRKSKTDLLEGTGITVHYLTNYNNPSTWEKTVKTIVSIKPDFVIFQWAISIQGIPLGYIAKKLRKHNMKVVFDLHFVVQKENSTIDKRLTKNCIKNADMYIVHSLKTANELKELYPNKLFRLVDKDKIDNSDGTKIIKLYHPIYDMFKPDENFDKAKHKKEMNLREHVFLFFGFIRKYKGLHNVIKSFAEVAKKRDDVSLLIVGESFWNTLAQNKLSTKIKNVTFGLAKSLFLKKQDDERNYNPLELVKILGLEDKTYIVNEFVPNEDVHKYFQVSDYSMLYYHTATPSGVESIGYNFCIPMLVTKVGHFPENIKDGYNGYLAEPDNIESMSKVMLKALENPIDRNNVAETAKTMSWENYVKTIIEHIYT